MKPVIALVDCNNFYASCEKLFRPDLKHKPLIVLSNNDGCVVARSREAKALGIKMGVPVFQVRALIREHGIAVFSSNYALYADMSSRVMRVLEMLAPEVEIYSIDEAFLELTGVSHAVNLTDLGTQVRATVGQWTGIAVCVGIAPTKTLAKLANHAAKQYPATRGVVDLTDPERQRRLMALLPVSEVWGIGRRLTLRLNQLGIKTALDLAQTEPHWIQKEFSIVVARTVRELNGESCLELESVAPPKKQIVCSRSFGERIMDKHAMRGAIGQYTARAGEKLRHEKQVAKRITVFIRTSLFNAAEPSYGNTVTSELLRHTSDTRDLLAQSHRLLDSIWRDGYRYAKAGIMLSDFCSEAQGQRGLFDGIDSRPHSPGLMKVIDQINQQKRGLVFLAGQGIKKGWSMRRDYLSPGYTTHWQDLPRVM